LAPGHWMTVSPVCLQRRAGPAGERRPSSRPARPSTLVRRLDAFDGLQARANLYRDALQVHVADLEATLAGLTTSLERLLVQREAA
jgi:hypothetical protein